MVKRLELAKSSQKTLLNLTPNLKEKVLLDMLEEVKNAKFEILEANKLDVMAAKSANLNSALIERLTLDDKKIDAILASLLDTARLKDPVGVVLDGWVNYAGLKFQKVAIPIGVVCVIYESRPNVTAEVASLCFKSSNVCILKGGKEAKHSNLAIVSALHKALVKNGIDKNVITFLDDFKREDLINLIKMDKFIDVIVPRGGSELVKFISQNSSIPVIKHDKGMCHIYIDESANLANALKICINAKCQKPSACNAVETLLIHKNIANEFLLNLANEFVNLGVEIYGCEKTVVFLSKQIPNLSIKKANDESYDTEYLDMKINVKIVHNLDEALDHIERFSSSHSEAIISENFTNIERFLNEVDSACLYANASTRFSDGYEFGFGAEVGISTNKLHARGPMGLSELTTYKYKIIGQGQVRK
ncbi:glutamate-5-semialdehyde dehydrogenase [Campylobacter geochelonis]|uniref:glutamate-5-semialdehyde dehydrogenase n=1 Tax=Campylobacter geochelonis TaxID=1780362 RepID=UPI0007707A2C|nr:glutamate-5-semialdehyde dehydrogenase [Campylobacter geochelonis]CZE47834.1 gamma-glutamyl phosphate reductase [Campylobacter geochelonis]